MNNEILHKPAAHQKAPELFDQVRAYLALYPEPCISLIRRPLVTGCFSDLP